MSRRAVKWVAGLGVLEVIVLALTIHATVTYHRADSTDPSVISVGPVLGWIVSVLLLVAVALVVRESRR